MTDAKPSEDQQVIGPRPPITKKKKKGRWMTDAKLSEDQQVISPRSPIT
jgi:hypothetical protein